jgi:hypothetical protein
MSVVAVIIDVTSMILGLSLLIFFDLIMGIRKSLFKKGIKINLRDPLFWNTITSKQLRNTWRKSYEYGVGIIVCGIFQSLIFDMESIIIMSVPLSITEGAIVVASVVELYSIAENLRAVSGVGWISNVSKVMRTIKGYDQKKEDYHESID